MCDFEEWPIIGKYTMQDALDDGVLVPLATHTGKPVVRGTRISVGLVLEELTHNPDIAELLAAHPDLTRADVQACLAYAKAMMVTGRSHKRLIEVRQFADQLGNAIRLFAKVPR